MFVLQRKKFLIASLFLGIALVPYSLSAKDKKKENNEQEVKALISNAKYDDIALFSRVLSFVEKEYVQSVDIKELVYGAIKGMLEGLDAHSTFLRPEVFRQMKNDTSGQFGGLGIEIWVGRDGSLTVINPMEETPAWRAGVKAGDKIIEIDGDSTKGMSLNDAIGKLRGKPGQPIRLTVLRDGLEQPKEIKIVRAIIHIKSVKYKRLTDEYAYIRLNHFQEKSADELKAAIASLESKKKLRGIILDLRNNPGGLLDQAVEVANLFIDKGIIVSTKERDDSNKEERKARPGRARTDLELAVLVNGNSASAAEIVAGAIKDHKRGILLGGRTFGKGSVQKVIPLGDDVGIKLTVARYYTPNGTSIQAAGIDPDIHLDEVDPDLFEKAKRQSDYLREADLKNHFEGDEIVDAVKKEPEKTEKEAKKDDDTPRVLDPEKDYQVQQALNYLKGFNLIKQIDAARNHEQSESHASAANDRHKNL